MNPLIMKQAKLLASCLLLTWIMSASLSIAAESQLYQVRVSKVIQQDRHTWIHVYGRISFDDAALQNISLAYSGQIIRIPVLAGEFVSKGQILAEIAVDPAVASAYQRALAAVKYAAINVDRIKKMLADRLATKTQLSTAQKTLADSRSQLLQLQQKGFDTSIHIIRAEFDAVVTSIAVQAGQRTVAGTTLMQLGHPDQLKVVLGVEPSAIRQIKRGNKVLIHSNAVPDKIIQASIEQVLHTVNPQTRLVDVLVRLDGDQTEFLIPGMSIEADIKGEILSQALLIPKTALAQQGTQTIVMRMEQGVVHSVPVQVVLEQGEHVVVYGELTAGELVVTDGIAELTDDDHVQLKDAL